MHRVRLFAGLLVLAAVVTAAWMTVEAERSSTAAGGQTLGFVVFLRNLAEESAPFARLRTGTLVASLGLTGLSLTILVLAGRMTRAGR